MRVPRWPSHSDLQNLQADYFEEHQSTYGAASDFPGLQVFETVDEER